MERRNACHPVYRNYKEVFVMVYLFSTGCSRCRILEAKLRQKNIEYTKIEDEDTIIAEGVAEIPSLNVDGKLLGFIESIDWVNGQ